MANVSEQCDTSRFHEFLSPWASSNGTDFFVGDFVKSATSIGTIKQLLKSDEVTSSVTSWIFLGILGKGTLKKLGNFDRHLIFFLNFKWGIFLLKLGKMVPKSHWEWYL